MRRILLWVNLLTVLLVLGQTAVAVCQEIPAYGGSNYPSMRSTL